MNKSAADRMAKYKGDDQVTDTLLNQVVKHANHDEIGFFAPDLRVEESTFSNIARDKDRTFKVFKTNPSNSGN